MIISLADFPAADCWWHRSGDERLAPQTHIVGVSLAQGAAICGKPEGGQTGDG
ncbi:hypothetical protein [Klebsiella oxytoca]